MTDPLTDQRITELGELIESFEDATNWPATAMQRSARELLAEVRATRRTLTAIEAALIRRLDHHDPEYALAEIIAALHPEGEK